nr:hypothetical protein [Sarcina ventriculi]
MKAFTENFPLEELVMLNTIALPEDNKNLSKFKSLSIAPLLADAIKRIYDDKPLSSLF